MGLLQAVASAVAVVIAAGPADVLAVPAAAVTAVRVALASHIEQPVCVLECRVPAVH